ncbi:Calx-beta domain-containing protein [Microcoleus sp. FACHB-68]|uniref:beta strand repeat-containing protein n=1 Tax=Microcoleus sp. FACHB-68 TaxID=2692826 RepID=UPI00168A0A2E|nr:Calx-beta domain-containing protein [Microcoleus sp. FACHB-68]MBD1935844.1 hypothetical protein [Microcoleus sp. FACHB-68]
MAVITGTPNFDSLAASQERDVVYCKEGSDSITGDSGDDVLYGDSGNDLLYGGLDNDILLGNFGDDTLDGGKGEDILYGDNGNDSLRGGNGADRLFGGAGSDTLISDSGADLLNGGQGSDTFVFGKTTGGVNLVDAATVTDFKAGEDIISLIDDLTFDDIKIFQGSDGFAKDTVIQEIATGRYFAVLRNVDSRTLTGNNFPATPSPTPTGETPTPQPTPIPTPTPTPDAGSLEFSAANFSVNEDGTPVIAVSVRRIGDSVGAVSATVTLTNGSAVTPDDYSNTSITVNFADNDITTKTLSIPIVDDALIEGNETVNLTLASPTGGATIGAQSTATLEILDNEVPNPGTLQFSTADFSFNEDGTPVVQITVTRGGGNAGAVSAQIFLNDDTAICPDDYNNTPLTVNFADGDNSPKTFNISIVDDALLEGNENINLVLGNPTGGATIGAQSTAILEILDNEVPQPGTLEFSAATFKVNEDGVPVATVTVTRTNGSDGAVGAQVTLTNGTAISPNDYNSAPISVSFANGEDTPKTLTIPIVEDTLLEATETVNLALASPTGGATIGAQSTATLEILDNEVPNPGTLQFSAANFSVNENGTPVIQVTVSRGGGSDGAVSATVNLSNGTAVAPDDYTNTPITVNFANGENTPKTVLIPLVDDSLGEADETVNLTLSAPAGGATLGAQSTAILTIEDNEPGQLQFTTAAFSGNEGDTGTPILGIAKISRTGGSYGAVSVGVQLDTPAGSATTPNDYTNNLPLTINFADGETSKDVLIPMVGDTTYEPDESINLRLVNPAGGVTLGSQQTATYTIVNDDPDITPPTAAIQVLDITQGGSTTYTFTVDYTDNAAINVSSLDNNDIQVTGPNNFNQLATFVSVNPAGTGTPLTATYQINAPGGSWDLADNGSYTVNLLTNQVLDTTGNTAAATQSSFNVNAPLPADSAVSVATTTASVYEDSGSGLVYTFTRTDSINTPLSSTLTVNYTVAGSATSAENDYSAVGGIVTFAAGSDTATVSIIPTVDSAIEPDETVDLTLSAGAGYTVGTPNAATGKILDDDGRVLNANDAGSGSLRQALINANNAPAGTYTISLSGITGTINLLSALPAINNNVILNGPGANFLTVKPSASAFNIFTVNSGKSATFNGLTIANGFASQGGGILNNGGTVSVINSAISNNRARDAGGGIYNSGGTVNITNSTISGNNAYNGSVEVTSSDGGGIYNANGIINLTNSTVSGNQAIGSGGGTTYGGGILNTGGIVSMINSTIASNSADFGGGISNGGTVNAKNTIIAGNTANSPDFGGSLTSQGYNLIGNTAGTTIAGTTTGNKLNVSANLSPLQDNGSTTLTHALLSGSPAINAGDPGATAPDQRGVIRAGTPDIGAFESNGIVRLGTSGNDVLTGTVITNPFYLQFPDIFLAGLGNDTLTGNGNNDTFMYTSIGEGVDTITDFNSGDKFQFTSANFGNLNAAGFSEITVASAADNISSHELIVINTPGVNSADLVNTALSTQSGAGGAGGAGGAVFFIYTNASAERVLGYDPDVDTTAGGVFDIAKLGSYTLNAAEITFV